MNPVVDGAYYAPRAGPYRGNRTPELVARAVALEARHERLRSRNGPACFSHRTMVAALRVADSARTRAARRSTRTLATDDRLSRAASAVLRVRRRYAVGREMEPPEWEEWSAGPLDREEQAELEEALAAHGYTPSGYNRHLAERSRSVRVQELLVPEDGL